MFYTGCSNVKLLPLQVGKQHDAIGLDGEVVNRRRTISGPVTDLVAAARSQRDAGLAPGPGPMAPTSDPRQGPESQPSSGGSSAENLPFAEEGNLTIKQRPRKGEGDGEELPVYSLPQEELSRVDATATLKRRVRSSKQQQQHPNGAKFHLTESNTVKRRPKSRDKDAEDLQNGQMPVAYQNGTGTIKRRPPSEGNEPPQQQQQQPHQQQQQQQSPQQPKPQENTDIAPPRRDSADMGSQGAETPRKVKPPVSPKPVLAQHMKKQGAAVPSSKKAPFPGPGGPASPGKLTLHCF